MLKWIKQESSCVCSTFYPYGYSYTVFYAFVATSFVEKKELGCFFEVDKSPNYSFWIHAMKEEMSFLHKNKTWVLVPKPLK